MSSRIHVLYTTALRSARCTQKLTATQTPLQAVPQARAGLERPPLPLAWPSAVYSRAFRGQSKCHRATPDEGALLRWSPIALVVVMRCFPPASGRLLQTAD